MGALLVNMFRTCRLVASRNYVTGLRQRASYVNAITASGYATIDNHNNNDNNNNNNDKHHNTTTIDNHNNNDNNNNTALIRVCMWVMHRGMDQVIALSVEVGEGGFGARP